jgi:deoxyribonuclease V
MKLNSELVNYLEVTPSDGIQLQKKLSKMVSRRWDGREVELVAGMDVHFPSKKIAKATIVLLDFKHLRRVESTAVEVSCNFPYVPGLLSFREIPPLLEAWKKLKHMPDLILCDGQGIAHPRGLGLASHIGLILDIPTVGCAKSPLYGTFQEPGPQKGDQTSIRDNKGNIIGKVLRTRDNTRPLYISVGHRINILRAVKLVLQCTPRYRISEPLRAAHRLAGSKS